MKRIILSLFLALGIFTAEAQNFVNYSDANMEVSVTAIINVTPPQESWGKHGVERNGAAVVSVGYNFDSHFYLGFATGSFFDVGLASNEGGSTLLPTLADIRYTFAIHKHYAPFLQLRSGYGFTINNSGHKDYVIFNPVIGIKFPISEVWDIRLSGGYTGLWSQNQTIHRNLNSISLQIGSGIRF